MPYATRSAALLAAATGLALAALPAPSLAQDHAAQIRARQGQMQVQAANLGVLVGMARGQIEYDAEAAQVAADNLVAIGMIDQRFFWPEGSSVESGADTKALPAIWEDYDDFIAKWEQYGEAAAAMQANAAGGVEAVGASLRELGGACGACHETYQLSE